MIATLPFMHTLNYGAELQGFALQHKLKLMGYDSVAMDIARPYLNSGAHKSHFKRTYDPGFKARLRQYMSPRRDWVKNSLSHPIRIKRKWRVFNDFNNQYKKSTEKFRSFDDLYKADLPYTHYIVGGDQMWNYRYPYALDPFFMTFAKDGAKRIAYAVSFGVKSIPEKLKDKYRHLLEGMDAVSTRELHGAEIIKDLTSKEVPTLLDPTILLTKEQWCRGLDIELDFKQEPYLIMYLRKSYEYILQLAESEAKRLGLKIKYITSDTHRPFKGHPDIEVIYDASPKDFVRLFAGASFAITNSFHGTAFSVNFNIPFWCVVNPKAVANSRYESLLKLTAQSNRMITLGTELVETGDVDFNETNRLLNLERNISEEFLLKALQWATEKID